MQRAVRGEQKKDKGPAPAPLELPAMGIEAEFSLFVDGEKVRPEAFWAGPQAFIRTPVLARSGASAQLPTGGAVYFDEGVLEVVTPVIEQAPGCALRAVRNLWEQIGFVRDELTAWGGGAGHDVRLAGFSAHYNVSFAPPAGSGGSAEALALLLAYVLPAPFAFLTGNRRSTGVGVRPRGDRIEITADFTPDPGLMIAGATFLLGVVQGMMTWPDYALTALDAQRVPTLLDVTPGKHSSRQGWLVRDYHYPRSPFTTGVDARVLPARDGRTLSLRGLARELFWRFRKPIRQWADPVSFRLLSSVLEGRTPSLLELTDRPAAYEDVGRACRWGHALPELDLQHADGRWQPAPGSAWSSGSFVEHVAERDRERAQQKKRLARDAARARGRGGAPRLPAAPPLPPAREPLPPRGTAAFALGYRGKDRRLFDDDSAVQDRRVRPAVRERRIHAHDEPPATLAAAGANLRRSSYEEVFLRIVSGARLRLDGVPHVPQGLRGWSEAVFKSEKDGSLRTLGLDSLRALHEAWTESVPLPRASR